MYNILKIQSGLLSSAVFRITFKDRVSTRNFEGLKDAHLSTSSQVYCLVYLVRLSTFAGFDLRDTSLIWNTGLVHVVD